jgi:glycerol-3-phosphate dehydrogenase
VNRDYSLQQLADRSIQWDIVVIGGGATGLGVAVEAASRGYRTALLEQHDFAKGTSSRSTKLVHGGVRYLRQGNIALVTDALRERGLLMRNAPHLVQNREFVVPNYEWWEGPFYGVGMKVYDALAGDLGIGKSKWLSREETLERIPTLEREGLRGGVVYYDGQFDDARLAVNLAQTAADHGAVAANYMRVTALLKEGDLVRGLRAFDAEGMREIELKAQVIINATGVFVDKILQLDEPAAQPIITPSQGIHLVLDKKFLPGESAIMVPHTDDGRVLFAVPWHGKVIVGTTDTPVHGPTLEPVALAGEVEFVLKHAGRYIDQDPTPADVLSVFAGLRPLVKPGDARATSSISRDHHLAISRSGLVTITGGKWTTYRQMGEETVDQAALVGGLEVQPSRTRELRIHGWAPEIDRGDRLSYYGADATEIRKLISSKPELGQKLHQRFPYLEGEVLWAVQHEMARTVEDVLARRTRALFLDARASIEAAARVAEIMAEQLTRPKSWIESQVAEYSLLAKGYLLA